MHGEVAHGKYAHLEDGKLFLGALVDALMHGVPVPVLAEALGVSARTIIRYAQGANRPMPAVQAYMIPIVQELGDRKKWAEVYRNLADLADR